ncbi:hypothetical protein, partial [Blastomonas fulva]|uniref:hypothetical protein n=1 Tax=Blastomonas fulva TaxID=1550728 RepID=UPI003F710BBD
MLKLGTIPLPSFRGSFLDVGSRFPTQSRTFMATISNVGFHPKQPTRVQGRASAMLMADDGEKRMGALAR